MTQDGAIERGDVLPPAAVFIDADGWHVAVELPGVVAEDLVVTWFPGTLSVEAERSSPHAPQRSVQLCEGRYGRLSRLFDVPDTYDPTRAQAVLDQGLLRISLPPREPELLSGRPLRLVT